MERNRNNIRSCKLFGDEKIEYPVHFDLKVIMTAAKPDEENKELIGSVLIRLAIPHSGWRSKQSRQGSYTSYSVAVTITDDATMKKLYRELAFIPEVKYAL